jgi:glycerophosphoryl diester phosphodiesterase
MLIFAHRGFSGRQPEATRAAYLEAIAWSARTGHPLGLECDVQFSADDELICLHDLDLDRTSDATGPAVERTVAELRRVDFGSWRVRRPDADQRALITLAELLELVRTARDRGVEVSLVIETKHPNPRGLDIEDRVAEMLRAYDWHRPGSPVRVISFSVPAVDRLGLLLPDLERTLLIEATLAPWTSGVLPSGVAAAGPDLALLRADPGFVARTRGYGHGVQAWTVNRPADVELCRALGVTAITTDHPDRVAVVLGR